MRPLVLDPGLLASGALGDEECRRLMGLLAYGRWSQYIRLTGPAEEAKMREELGLVGSGLRGGVSSAALLNLAADRRAAMAAIVPLETPDDLVLVSSRWLRRAVISEVQDARNWRPSAAQTPEIGMETASILSHITGFDLPESGDPVGRSAREQLVWVAAQTSAPLITEDVELAPRENTVFEITDTASGRPAYSAQLWTFIERVVNRYPFSLDQLPYELLDVSIR